MSRKTKSAVDQTTEGVTGKAVGGRNPVAKFDWRINKARVQTDRKKAAARGYRKHKSLDLPLSAQAA